MNSTRKTNELWQIVWPSSGKLDHFLRPSRLLSLNRRLESSTTGDDSMKSLLAGKSSDGDGGWRNPAAEVPRGFLAVYVGPEMTRFVIPATYLSLPDFKVLMERVAEEFGFEQEGALRIPCEENYFEEILLRCFATHQTMMKKKKAT